MEVKRILSSHAVEVGEERGVALGSEPVVTKNELVVECRLIAEEFISIGLG